MPAIGAVAAEPLSRPEVSPRTKGARRCTNHECEYGGRSVVRTMRVLRNGKFNCLGKGCHTVYAARDVIDPANKDYVLYVRWRLSGDPRRPFVVSTMQ